MASIPTQVDVTPGSGTGLGTALMALALSWNGVAPVQIPTVQNTKSPLGLQQVSLSTAELTVTVPATAQGIVIIPPSGNSVLIQCRKTTTVVTQAFAKGVLVQPFDGAVPASVLLYSASAVDGVTVMFY